jgi:tryptophan 2,3-dioxygenase
VSTRKLRGSAAHDVDSDPAEPIVEFAEVTPYELYVGVRELQGLVRTVTDHPAEPSFLVVTQIMELWFTLLRREWELAQRCLRTEDLDGAIGAIRRSVHHLRSLNATWGSLMWMTPAEFNGFREQLG